MAMGHDPPDATPSAGAPAPPGASGPQSAPQPPGRPDPMALLRSRGYIALLAAAAVLGVPVAAAAYGFLVLVGYLQ